MGMFSNGTEGLLYQESYCFHSGYNHEYCCNYKERDDGLGLGCPVHDLHLFFNGNPEWAAVCNHLIPIIEDETGARCNGKCIWHNRQLDVDTEEVINMSLDDWKQLERGDGDIDVQLRFSFMPDALVMLRHDGIPDPEEIRILRKPTTPMPHLCEPDGSR